MRCNKISIVIDLFILFPNLFGIPHIYKVNLVISLYRSVLIGGDIRIIMGKNKLFKGFFERGENYYTIIITTSSAIRFSIHDAYQLEQQNVADISSAFSAQYLYIRHQSDYAIGGGTDMQDVSVNRPHF